MSKTKALLPRWPLSGTRGAIWVAVFGLSWLCGSAQGAGYLPHAELTARLRDVVGRHPAWARMEALATSIGDRAVWRLELGAGSAGASTNRPAMLAVGGLEGNDLAGPTILLHWAEGLLASASTNEATRRLLETTTLHVIPRLNVDAAESFFAQPRVERSVSLQPFDGDRDGLVDEDGPEDMNGDGLITWMRVEDPEGELRLDGTDARLLVKADRAKGERGGWRLLVEGRDNDHDEGWNEDDLGGVNFNRNFPFGYRFFEADTGRHPVSEVETRALADFVVAHPSIGVVFAYGAGENLTQTPKAEPGGRRPPTAVHEGDLPIWRELGKGWREALGLKKELPGLGVGGTFADWVYFHRGRLALAARPWSSALQVELGKAGQPEAAKAEGPGGEAGEAAPGAGVGTGGGVGAAPAEGSATPAAGPPAGRGPGGRRGPPGRAEPAKASGEGRVEEDRAWLQWADKHYPEGFVPWKEIEHPDFPGRKVEVGGEAPFARSNPPLALLEDLAVRQGGFLTALAGRLPRVGFRKAEARHLGEWVYEIVVQVENQGYLPTAMAQGAVSGEVDATRLLLGLEDKDLVAGSRRTLLGPIEGSGGMVETRWVVRVKGRSAIRAEVVSTLGGSAQVTIELPEVR